LIQDPDVLDTWFSSALWPHSTLGWPEATPELAKYYPTSLLSTARDIISLWVARMVIFGQFNMNDVPFRDVFIHPVIQDGNGKRMSKSAGNGIDPVDIIDLYGADALRYTLASLVTETQDLRMPVEKAKLPDGREVNTSERFEQGRTFPNKFWNASRFVLMNLEDYDPDRIGNDVVGDGSEDLWILGRLNQVVREVNAGLESFRFAEVAKTLRDFTWNDFCDWYVELTKGRLRDPERRPIAQAMLVLVLDGLCRLLHPIIPFVTEQVWQGLNQVAPRRFDPASMEIKAAAESVCVASWPTYPESWNYPDAEAIVGHWREKITALRNLRAERNIPPSAKIAPVFVATGPTADALLRGSLQIKTLANAESVQVVAQAERPSGSAVAVLADAEIILPLEGLIDRKAELARVRKAFADVDKPLAATRAKLSNEAFLTRAPAEVVESLRAKEAELSAQRETLSALLATLDASNGGSPR
jgi:valyl-tRNA synthetase